ncbi:MAG: DnaJ C-terminal domain-containing protein [Sulfuritalea sp.]|nr:DnaJ C-terminal domain-containing protein [Sulfuritalea sp.]
MKFKDYYEILGVPRGATQDDVKHAYRKLARKYHPDVSKDADAETRFKELGEAYAVLKDPEKRAAYDQMGSQWKTGQDFQPPPGWDAGFEFSGGDFGAGAGADRSDFFEALFGRHAGAGQRAHRHPQGQDHHAKVPIDLVDAYRGAQRSISLRMPVLDAQGRVAMQERTLDVSIPKGIRAGQHLRLAGQGAPGLGTGAAGDLYLEIVFKPDPHFRADGRDVYLDLPLAPWEAALGASIAAPTPEGPVQLTIPPNSVAGRQLRLKGRGIPGSPPGDLYVMLTIALPPADSEAAREAYRAMAQAFDFNPRPHLEG